MHFAANTEGTQLLNEIIGKVLGLVCIQPVLKEAPEPRRAPHGHSLGVRHLLLFGELIANAHDALAEIKGLCENSSEGQLSWINATL